MGNVINKYRLSQRKPQTSVKQQKRKRDNDSDDESQRGKSKKRVKLNAAENYLFTTFYKESKNSDVTISAFNRSWKLHKIFLNQSPYFQSMFEGNFVESQLSEIRLNIEDDEFINEESLDLVFASFYSCEIQFTKQNVQNILVTARFLQCQEIVNQCEKILSKSLNRTNCISLYYFCNKYYLPYLEDFIFRWLLINLMIIKNNKLLSQMDCALWVRLIKNSGFVVETEYILYQVLRHYVQMKLLLSNSEEENQQIDVNYFKKRGGEAFLSTLEGKKFEPIFKSLRIRNLFTSSKEIVEVFQDNILPKDWILPHITENWISLLSIESSTNIGPNKEIISEEDFEKNAMRVSKIVKGPDIHRWRWTCFFFGLDLNFYFDGRNCLVKRVHHIDNNKILCGHAVRRVMFRIQIMEVLGDVTLTRNEIIVKTLKLNQEKFLIKLEKEVQYPVVLLMEILCVLPNCLSRMVEINSIDIPENQTTTSNSTSTDDECDEGDDEDSGDSSSDQEFER